MNKLTRGAIAGAAGIALLLGGAGTFATWNAQTTVNAGVIHSGELALVNSSDAGTWAIGTTTVADISTHRIVPGDTITYTKTLGIKATGDNLKATLAVDFGDLSSRVNPAGVALGTQLLSNAHVNVLSADSTIHYKNVSGSTVNLTVDPSDTTSNMTVSVTFTFPDTAGNNTQNALINLNNIQLRLDQVL